MKTRKNIIKLNDSKTEKSNLWFLIVVPLLIIAFFIYGELTNRNQESRLNSKGISTICYVKDKSYSKGPDIIAEYHVNEKKYIKRNGSPCKIEIGEKFEIIYNPDDPTDAKIIFSNPIIPESFNKTQGKITRIDDSFFKRAQYSYIINSKTFMKEQVVKDGKNISLGQDVLVFYNDSIPEESYIKW